MDLLLGALELEPAERRIFLEEACGSDDDLLREVEALVASDREAAEDFLDSPAAVEMGVGGASDERLGDLDRDVTVHQHSSDGPTLRTDSSSAPSTRVRIGRYAVLRRLGEGGMGVVYLAEQTEPVRRRVALKVIKLGMDTRQVVSRFESERQALALMNHPNIAQVFDAGATDEGRPYFVMEYVGGAPITRYCDGHKLDTRQRLEMFIQVCEGVQHAHHKGIIHRDIKPSNVLVTVRDDRPLPKIIDFGLAKATAPGLAEGTCFTEHGALVGTPDYMSPEQAGAVPLDVDSRTDVYSLGVLLYELLVGTVPFERRRTGVAGVLDLRTWMDGVAPPRPSTRLTDLEEAAPSSAKSRGTNVSGLVRTLRGDLDWITMRALEKDRSRRYSTPAELAADIRHHLRDEPVVAGPPSALYRVGKFIRRHQTLVVATGAVVVALLLGVAAASTGLVRANRARDEAESQRAMATLEAEKARALSDFLQTTLASPDPAVDGRDVRVVEILDRAAGEIEGQFSAQPEVEAEVRAAIGSSYRGLGLFDEAEVQLQEVLEIRRKALGSGDPGSAKAKAQLALVRGDRGNVDEAIDLYREALDVQTATLGSGHVDTLGTTNDLANLLMDRGDLDEAEALFRRVLAFAADDAQMAEIFITRGNFAYLLQKQGLLEEAEVQYGRAISGLEEQVGERHPRYLDALNNFGTLLMEMGRLEEAEKITRRALLLRRDVLGDTHPWTLHSINNLAAVVQALGRLDEAEPLYREAVEGNRRLLGVDHPETLTAVNNLAYLLEDRGRVGEAEGLFRMVVERRLAVLGEDHLDTLIAMHNLAALLLGDGRLDEAERWSRRAVEGSKQALPPGHYLGAVFAGRLGVILTGQRRFAEAEGLFLANLPALERELGQDHPRTVQTRQHLADLYEDWGRGPGSPTP